MRITELAITADDDGQYHVSGKTLTEHDFGPFVVDVVKIGGVRLSLTDGGTIEIDDSSGTSYEIDFTTLAAVAPNASKDGTDILEVRERNPRPEAIPVEIQER